MEPARGLPFSQNAGNASPTRANARSSSRILILPCCGLLRWEGKTILGPSQVEEPKLQRGFYSFVCSFVCSFPPSRFRFYKRSLWSHCRVPAWPRKPIPCAPGRRSVFAWHRRGAAGLREEVRPGKPVYPSSFNCSPGFLSGSGYVNIPFNGSGASPLCLSLLSVRLSCVSLMGEEGSVSCDFVHLGSRGVLGLGDGLLLFFF